MHHVNIHRCISLHASLQSLHASIRPFSPRASIRLVFHLARRRRCPPTLVTSRRASARARSANARDANETRTRRVFVVHTSPNAGERETRANARRDRARLCRPSREKTNETIQTTICRRNREARRGNRRRRSRRWPCRRSCGKWRRRRTRR